MGWKAVMQALQSKSRLLLGEKIKIWNRKWKLRLIQKDNLGWIYLWEEIVQQYSRETKLDPHLRRDDGLRGMMLFGKGSLRGVTAYGYTRTALSVLGLHHKKSTQHPAPKIELGLPDTGLEHRGLQPAPLRAANTRQPIRFPLADH